jgi:hypothetical protein
VIVDMRNMQVWARNLGLAVVVSIGNFSVIGEVELPIAVYMLCKGPKNYSTLIVI